MPEESETATFGVIKPAQEVRNARTDAPLGGPDAESVHRRGNDMMRETTAEVHMLDKC